MVSIFRSILGDTAQKIFHVHAAQSIKKHKSYKIETTESNLSYQQLKKLLLNAIIDRPIFRNLLYTGKFYKFALDSSNMTELNRRLHEVVHKTSFLFNR